MSIGTVTTAVDLAGVLASALLGGGVIRDILLQHGPPAALVNPVYIPTALAGTGLAFLLDVSGRGWGRILIVLDAAALSLWAAAGAQKTLAPGSARCPRSCSAPSPQSAAARPAT